MSDNVLDRNKPVDSFGWKIVEYHRIILKYMAGSVVSRICKPFRKYKKGCKKVQKVVCKTCKELLISTKMDPNSDPLTYARNWGGLSTASADVNFMLFQGLLVFEELSKEQGLYSKTIFYDCMEKTLKILPKNLFESEGHPESHKFKLIEQVLTHFFNAKIGHESKRRSQANPTKSDNIRQINNKLTLFKSQ